MIERPTKCKYKFCPNEVPVATKGPQALYCSVACKQAEYRRRNPNNDRKRLKQELLAARVRVRELERFVQEHTPTGYRLARDIPSIRLGRMLDLHHVGGEPVAIALQNNLIKPDEDGQLDAKGQETFYVIFHGLPYWRSCEDCPHGVIP